MANTANNDIFFVEIQALVGSATTFAQHASRMLDVLSDLNNFSDTLSAHLTTQTKLAFDSFWAAWSADILNMAQATESMGILLSNSAAYWLKTDEAIIEAFNGDPAEKAQIDDEINGIDAQSKTFQDTFAKDVEKQKEVANTVKEDKKAVYVHKGGLVNGKGGPQKFWVSKDGKFTLLDQLGQHPIAGEPGAILVDDGKGNGKKVWEGSQEAKDLYNNAPV